MRIQQYGQIGPPWLAIPTHYTAHTAYNHLLQQAINLTNDQYHRKTVQVIFVVFVDSGSSHEVTGASSY